MTAKITDNQLVSIVHRQIHFVGWLAFALFNNLILTICLLVFWWFGINHNIFLTQIQKISDHLGLQKLWPVLSFLGVSGAVIFSGYAMLWRKVYMALTLKYLFRNIEKQNIV